MLKVVDVCKRVEGHGEVKILLQNDEISTVNFEFEIYRRFENFLIGKNLFDIPKIASRICGLCYASQTIASCKAIENIYNIEVSEQSVLLRRLLMSAELIKSHSMNFFFQTLPDLLTIFNLSRKAFSPYELIKYYPQLTSSLYDLIKVGNEINELFGGRSVHLISLIPGGVIYSPSRKNIILARKYFQKALVLLERIIEKFIQLFANQTPPKEFDLPKFISLALTNHGNYDRYSGSLRFKENDKNLIEFEKQNYSTYFDKEINLRGIDFYFENEKNVMVGPFSRFNIVENYGIDEITTYLDYFNKSWKNNILFTNFIRLLEMYFESYQNMQILDDPSLNVKKNLPSLNLVENKEGIGVIEAPRGTLIHHYHLNKSNVVDRIRFFIATEFNIPLLNQMITKYAQELFEITGDINLVKKNVQIIIRAFDPCISCATH
ncbi:MAG: nickel-dependent hydrogenase large subunit [Candidatus Lokiarchaeota archaeon]|nr:nickel-dependent hydrogenase large subunit [Candidatus Lokiarchaeota archaeon]